MTDQTKIAGYLLSELEAIEANLTGPDYFAERVADSLRRCKEAIKHAEQAGVETVYIGDYLYTTPVDDRHLLDGVERS